MSVERRRMRTGMGGKTMQSLEEYMQGLKQWLQDTKDSPLEEMSDFFTKRLQGYEEHMSVWEESYRMFAEILPLDCRKILDLGCGTGLELDRIWKRNPDIEVTGVDLCQSMLDKLREKHSDKQLTIVCEDYFQYDFGRGKWDTVISFESLHHFLPERKRALYRKIYESLKVGGIFLLGDYIASCDEEEALLRGVYLERHVHAYMAVESVRRDLWRDGGFLYVSAGTGAVQQMVCAKDVFCHVHRRHCVRYHRFFPEYNACHADQECGLGKGAYGTGRDRVCGMFCADGVRGEKFSGTDGDGTLRRRGEAGSRYAGRRGKRV